MSRRRHSPVPASSPRKKCGTKAAGGWRRRGRTGSVDRVPPGTLESKVPGFYLLLGKLSPIESLCSFKEYANAMRNTDRVMSLDRGRRAASIMIEGHQASTIRVEEKSSLNHLIVRVSATLKTKSSDPRDEKICIPI